MILGSDYKFTTICETLSKQLNAINLEELGLSLDDFRPRLECVVGDDKFFGDKLCDLQAYIESNSGLRIIKNQTTNLFKGLISLFNKRDITISEIKQWLLLGNNKGGFAEVEIIDGNLILKDYNFLKLYKVGVRSILNILILFRVIGILKEDEYSSIVKSVFQLVERYESTRLAKEQ